MVLIGGLTGAIRQFVKDPTKVEQVIQKLTREADHLERQGRSVVRPADDWYGGSGTGRNLARHSVMAHEAVVEEFRNLASVLEQYRESIQLWDREVDDVEADAEATARAREQALHQVATTVAQAGRHASDSVYGDGSYDGGEGSDR